MSSCYSDTFQERKNTLVKDEYEFEGSILVLIFDLLNLIQVKCLEVLYLINLQLECKSIGFAIDRDFSIA